MGLGDRLLGLNDPQIDQVNPNSPQITDLQGGIADFLQNTLRDPSGFNESIQSPLQRQATGGIQQFLGQPSPEQQVLDQLSPGLTDIFDTGIEGFSEAAFPLFQRMLQEGQGALANRGQGRFSTTFERQGVDLAQRSIQDFNLLTQQAFQQNTQNRLGAASLLGSLSGQAGSAPFNRLATAAQIGQVQTNPALRS
jgi:hypothetical protein